MTKVGEAAAGHVSSESVKRGHSHSALGPCAPLRFGAMIAELILIVVLLAFIAFGVYILILDVSRWRAKDGAGVQLPAPVAVTARSAPSGAVAPSRSESRRSVSASGKYDFRPSTLEGIIGDYQVKDLVAQMRDPSKRASQFGSHE